MNSYKLITFLGLVLLLQLTAGRPQIPREFINFGNPFENPPDIKLTSPQLEANLLKESAQANTLDPSIIAELEQSNEPVIRTYLDENGNNHTETYTKNANGTISKHQTGRILLKDLNKNGNQIPGVGSVPVDELLQGSGVVNTVYTDENVQQHGVYRLYFKTNETIDGNTPSTGASDGRTMATTPRAPTATTPRTTTTTTTLPPPPPQPTLNAARQPTIADSIFSDLNRMFDSYWVKPNGKNTLEIFRPTLLSSQEFFARHSNVFNPVDLELFEFNEEPLVQTYEPIKPIKEVRIASDGKTAVSVCYWPISGNSILTRKPLTTTIIKTRAGLQILTKAAQLLNANKSTIYFNNALAVGSFVSGL